MRLYEINDQINELLESAEINEETGEVLIDYAKLESLEMARETKIENVIKYYLDLEGDIAKYTEEIKELTKRRKSMENKHDSLKSFLDTLHNGNNANYGVHKISYRASKSLLGESLDAVPIEYIKTERKPLRSELKAYIEAGNIVDGWEIAVKKNIQIK